MTRNTQFSDHMSYIHTILQPPVIEDNPVDQQNAFVVHWMLALSGATLLIATIFFSLIVPNYASVRAVFISAIVGFVILSICKILMHVRNVYDAAKFFVFSVTLSLLMGSFIHDGLNSFELEYLVAPIAVAFLTLNPRWGITTALACIIAVIGIATANLLGIIPAPSPETYSATIIKTAAHMSMVIISVSAFFYASKRATDQANQQLQNNEKRIHQLLDLMADAALQLQVDGTVVAMNQRATMILGYEQKDLVGKNVSVLTSGRTDQQVRDTIEQMTFNVPVISQFPIQTKHGIELIGERRSVKLNLNGDLIIFTLIRDVTDEIRIQDQLAKSRAELSVVSERLSLVANNVPALMSFIDSEENVLFLNDAFQRLGVQTKEVVGKHISEVFNQEAYRYVRPFLDQTFTTATTIRFDFPTTLPDGKHIIIDTVHIPHVVDQKVTGYISLGHDVTEERELINALRDSQQNQRQLTEQLQLVADHLPVRIAYIDKDWIVRFANRSYENVIQGITREAWLDTHASDLVPPSLYRQVAPRIEQCLKGEEVKFEICFDDPDPSRSWIAELHYVPHFHQSEVVGLISLSRDVTEERKQQDALRESQRLESLGLMAGGIAHDFNNLLSAILGQASLAKLKLDLTHPAHQHIEKSVRAAERASGLTNQMLAYSGRGQFEVRPINLNKLISDNLHLFESSFSKNIRLQLDLQPDLPMIEADSAQMQQVVMNLILNATQAIGAVQGQIELQTAVKTINADDVDKWMLTGERLSTGNYVAVEIRDNGVGMSKEQMKKIFEPFFSTKDEGSGLGLSAVLGIIRGHRGGIRVTSELGSGTCFALLFPSYAQASHLVTAESDGLKDLTVAPFVGKVLIIDDEAHVSETVADMLDMYGIRSLRASGGREGLALYQALRDEIYLVLLDLMMPEMDGEETLQRLRAIDPTVHVVITSGYSEKETTKRFVGQNLAGFLQKPYQVDALIDKVTLAGLPVMNSHV